ncbi:transcriptional regulator, XRE family protein [Streptomyces xinghaiensis]|uniref:transcriptional regulator, XRE family protein n=1 Tax=Streptomyces xinghaiensis TaxID=1038928 RepID=UPI002E11DC32|nr:transcriptional regulator, XRE family protein [Streptomyces xinghaiensis]
MPRPTLFRVLVQERRWDSWAAFCPRFEQAARLLAKETDSPRLAAATVGRRTFDRWVSGDWRGRPRSEAAQVLEQLFGFPCADLFSPAPDVLDAKATVQDRPGLCASVLIGERWPTSRLFMAATRDVADTWELAGRQSLDGTTVGVQFHAASQSRGGVCIRPSDPATLEHFLRPARRGLLVGVIEQSDEPALYVTDSSNARRARTAGTAHGALALPTAHLLDDLTYGILWALVQLDDGLLADDHALDQEQRALGTYLSLPRSAPSRMAVPELTNVGSQWLGSAFCAQHIQRRLQEIPHPPLFWTREQTGEQAAAWLFYRHKADYLRAMAKQYAGASSSLSRAFCVPQAEVAASDRYERVLLFLAIALMESYGIHVQVTARPEYSEVDGFALVPGQRAVVANWVRTESIWAADTVTGRPALRGYHEAFSNARSDSVMRGPDPEARLRALAGYLDIPWPRLIRRCRELGECGVAGMVRPRSRHLDVAALDEVLRFLGTLVPHR